MVIHNSKHLARPRSTGIPACVLGLGGGDFHFSDNPRITFGSLPNQTLPSFSGLTALPNLIPNPVYTLATAFSKNYRGHNLKGGLSYLHSQFDSPALATNTNGTAGFANDAQNALN